jgi:hypothetical protein
MDAFRLATAYFRALGFDLTDKAREAAAVAIGLAGSTGDCDEGFVAIGLRHSNSILALIEDKYKLDFSFTDKEVDAYLEVKERDEIWEELRRRGYRGWIDENLMIKDPISTEYETIYREEEVEKSDYESEDESFRGEEGEPDPETVEFIGNKTSPIFTLASKICRSDGRRCVETFDLVQSVSKLPVTSSVFEMAKLSEEQIRHEIARYKTIEPYAERQKVLLTFDEGRIRIKTFGLLDGYKYEERKLSPQQIIVQINSPSPFILESTIKEFEELINWKNISERDIQMFIEQHPELLLRGEYAALHSQLILDRGDKGNLIPDFFAELHQGRYFDIIDLKKPNENIMVGGPNRRGFSAAVHSAIYQLREYRDYFDDTRNRQKFYERYGLKGWKPRVAVIIGRSPPVSRYEDFIKAKRSLFDAEVVTYDEIIERAQKRIITIGGRKSG